MKKRQVVVKSGGGFGRDSNNSSSMATSSLPAPRGGVRYGECLRNHAANIGGYALDGCREFMASGEEGTGAELICAACGCHRSYHRQELETQTDRRQVAASCDYETNFNGRHMVRTLPANDFAPFALRWCISKEQYTRKI